MKIQRSGSTISTYYDKGYGRVNLGTYPNSTTDDIYMRIDIETGANGIFHVAADSIYYSGTLSDGGVDSALFIKAYIEGATYRYADGTVTPFRVQTGTHNLGDSGVIPANNFFVDLGDGTGNREIPFDNQFYDGSRFVNEFWQHFDSLSPNNYNGNTITFTHGTNVVTAAVPTDGLFQLPQTTYVNLTGDFANPLLRWSNPYVNDTALVETHGGLSRYEIRVYSNGYQVCNKRLFNNLDKVDQSFDFSTVSFEFDSNKDYIIKVQTRLNRNIEKLAGNSEWIGLINKDEYSVFYSSDDFHPPIANAGTDQIIFDTIVLYGTKSSHPNGDQLKYGWRIQNITDASIFYLLEGEKITLSDLATGFYNVTLTVTDSEGTFATDDLLFSATGIKGCCDLDGDGRIGLPEAIHILKQLTD